MLRLTLFLCIGMFAALLIAGEDRGQLRPGLAQAVAEGRPIKVREPAQMKAPEAAVAELDVVAAPEPLPPTTPKPEAVAAADPAPAPYVEPTRDLVEVVEEPVFTLSTLGNELVPGEAGAPIDRGTEPAPVDGTTGTIWYVTANSVNVRAEPSTEAEVVGKLGNGEAALLVTTVDGEWARIVIQGDGMEGYVAMRYLTPEQGQGTP